MSLTLFKNITSEITEFEKNTLVPMIIDTLASKTVKNTVSSKMLSTWLKACGHNVSDIRVRKIISYISGMNIKKGVECNLGDRVIIAAGSGYYVTDDPAMVDQQIESLLDRRTNLDFRIDSLKAQKLNLQHKKSA